jgi:hypothetical protein
MHGINLEVYAILIAIVIIFSVFIAPRIRNRIKSNGDKEYRQLVSQYGVNAIVPYLLLDNNMGFPIGIIVIEQVAICIFHKKSAQFERIPYSEVSRVNFPQDIVKGHATIFKQDGTTVDIKLNQDMVSSAPSAITTATKSTSIIGREKVLAESASNLGDAYGRLMAVLQTCGVSTDVG